MTPKAYRIFQSRILEAIFSDLAAARTGRHTGPIVGEGAVETQQVKPYEFGDSPAHMDIPGTLINAMIRRGGAGLPIRLASEDIVIHRTRNSPKCATCVLLDMSGSMRYGGQYINAKRMALALQGLIQGEYPGDFLRFVEVYSFAKPRRATDIVTLMPKPVVVYDPVVRLKVDMSDPNISETQNPPHFTNIQHGLYLARQLLGPQDTPNRQVILITDGLPTAHFEDQVLYLLYPPDPRTETATLREVQAVRPRGHHHQRLPAAELEPVARGHPVRLRHGRVQQGPGVLHQRQGPGSVRGVGLCAQEENDHWVRGFSIFDLRFSI